MTTGKLEHLIGAALLYDGNDSKNDSGPVPSLPSQPSLLSRMPP